MSSPARLYTTLFFGVLVVGIAVLSYVVLRPFFTAIAWAIVLAVGFRRPWRLVERKLAPRRSLAAGLAAVLIALVVLLPAGFLGIVLTGQAGQAVARLGERLRASNVKSVTDLVALPSIQRAITWIQSHTGFSWEDIQAKATELATNASALVATASGAIVVGLFDTIITFLTTIFLLFFFLRDGEEIAAMVSDILPLQDDERASVLGRLRAMLESIFRGSLLCALIQGVLGGVGWAMAGLPSAVLAGAVMGILSLLPIGGTAIVWLPGAIWLFTSGHRGAAIFLVLWGALVTSALADNVLKPMLIRGDELSTVIVFLGVFGGLSAFGLLGLFIGPIALAAAVAILGALRDKARAARATVETPSS